MKIGIIGAGGIGAAHARQFVKAGCEVVLSNSRGPESLSALVRELGSGAKAGTVEDAAGCEIVVVAVTWRQLPDALAGLPPWSGRIAVDATNPILMPEFLPADLGGRTSSEVFVELVPGARVVKAGNTLPPELLGADPRVGEGRRVLFMSGDDADAKKEYARVLEKAGFAVADLGGLVSGGRIQQFPGGALPGLDLIRMSRESGEG
ncbi:MAG: NADPH-dependent F420 reductase [Opitutaceae bacterium]